MNKIERITQIIEEIFQDARTAITVECMFSRQNDSEKLKTKFDQSPEVWGLNIIHRCLLQEWILLLNKMLDGYGNNRASIATLIQEVENDTELKSLIIQNARNWNPPELGLAAYNEKLAIENLQAGIQLNNDSSPAKIELKKYRDRVIAHNLFDIKQEVALSLGYIIEIHDRLIKVVYGIFHFI